MYRTESLTADEAANYLDTLAELLCDAVEGGASVGFLQPLHASEARAYWERILPAVSSGERVLLVAWDVDSLMGTVQLGLVGWPSQRHRAEVMKLLVWSAARRRGIGTALMRAAEAEARRLGRTLLVLDTRNGDDSQRLYATLGYETLGVVPRYAVSPAGDVLEDVVFMYRELESGSGRTSSRPMG